MRADSIRKAALNREQIFQLEDSSGRVSEAHSVLVKSALSLQTPQINPARFAQSTTISDKKVGVVAKQFLNSKMPI